MLQHYRIKREREKASKDTVTTEQMRIKAMESLSETRKRSIGHQKVERCYGE